MTGPRVLHVTLALEGTPEQVVLAEHRPGIQTLQLGTALTLLLDGADAATLRACAAAFDQAADVQAGLEAVKPEPIRTVIRPTPLAGPGSIRLPDEGRGAA